LSTSASLPLISIISETGAAIWSETYFGPIAHCRPQSSPLPCISHFLNAPWKLCSVRVFSTTCDSASITSVMAAFQFYLQSGKQGKVTGGEARQLGWVGNDCHVVFGQKFPGGKGSVRRCVVMMQQPVLLSLKLHAESSHIFT
jgi:hypothetical protein